MKFSILALATVALSAESALAGDYDTGSDYENPGTDVQYPPGVDPSAGYAPPGPPPADRTNVYHPPHVGVDIDDCDDDEDKDWHYVHPGKPVYPEQPPHVWTTSTVTEVHTSTIVDCDSSVPHCPGDATQYTTVEVSSTVICPVPSPTETPGEPSKTYVPPPVSSSATETHTYTAPTGTPSWTKPGHGESTSASTSWPNSSTVVYPPPPAQTGGHPPHPKPPGEHQPPAGHPYPPPPAEHQPPAEHPYPPPGEHQPPAEHPPAYPQPPAEHPPAYPQPPAGHPVPPHGPKTTLVPEVPHVPIGTGSYIPPRPTPTGHIVTAGAAETAQRVGAALMAGLFVALA